MQEMWVWFLGQEDPLEEGMATHSNILAWKIPWTEESGGLQSIELQSRTWLKWLSTPTHGAGTVKNIWYGVGPRTCESLRVDLSRAHAFNQLLSILPPTYPGMAIWGCGEMWRWNGKDLGCGWGERQEGKERGEGRDSSYPKKVPSVHPKADSLGYNTWVFLLF